MKKQTLSFCQKVLKNSHHINYLKDSFFHIYRLSINENHLSMLEVIYYAFFRDTNFARMQFLEIRTIFNLRLYHFE